MSNIQYIHVNEILLPETDNFSKAFNQCSKWYMKSIDESLSKEERDEARDIWFTQKQCLELGIY